MVTQINTKGLIDEDIYVGIDVHKTNWKVTVLGQYISYNTFSQDPNPDTLHQHLIKQHPGSAYYSAYEAGFCGFWIHDRLKELGIKSIVVNPADIPTTDKEKRQKEDKRDSRKIARSLRAGELKAIRIPSRKDRQDRLLLRIRRNIVKDLQRNKHRIKGLLDFNGIKYPKQFSQRNTHWSNTFMQWLGSIEMDESSGQDALQALINNSCYLRQQLLDITRKIRDLSKTADYAKDVKLLCSLSGIGLLTAMTWLTEIGKIELYKNLDQLCGYIGLVPSTNSSSDTERVGDITPRGNKYLRSMLIENAWVAIRYDQVLGRKYSELCGRMKPNLAIIRIAKKLVSRIRYVLLNQTGYKVLT